MPGRDTSAKSWYQVSGLTTVSIRHAVQVLPLDGVQGQGLADGGLGLRVLVLQYSRTGFQKLSTKPAS